MIETKPTKKISYINSKFYREEIEDKNYQQPLPDFDFEFIEKNKDLFPQVEGMKICGVTLAGEI